MKKIAICGMLAIAVLTCACAKTPRSTATPVSELPSVEASAPIDSQKEAEQDIDSLQSSEPLESEETPESVPASDGQTVPPLDTQAAPSPETQTAPSPATQTATPPATQAAPSSETQAATPPATQAATPPATQTATPPATQTEPSSETQTATPPQAPATEAESSSGNMLSVAQGYVGQSVSALYAAIGRPSASDYAPSCIGEGEDGNLYYDGFTVYTYKEGNTEVINHVG